MHFTDSQEHRVLALQLNRDICMLYHELAQYSHIMGDLDYTNLYPLPYWDFIANSGLDWQLDAFIRDGSLVMLLAMSWDCIDGSGSYLVPHIPAAQSAVRSFSITDDQTLKLLSVVDTALTLAESPEPDTSELEAGSGWVHDTFVKAYFIQTSRDFGKAYFNG